MVTPASPRRGVPSWAVLSHGAALWEPPEHHCSEQMSPSTPWPPVSCEILRKLLSTVRPVLTPPKAHREVMNSSQVWTVVVDKHCQSWGPRPGRLPLTCPPFPSVLLQHCSWPIWTVSSLAPGWHLCLCPCWARHGAAVTSRSGGRWAGGWPEQTVLPRFRERVRDSPHVSLGAGLGLKAEQKGLSHVEISTVPDGFSAWPREASAAWSQTQLG